MVLEGVQRKLIAAVSHCGGSHYVAYVKYRNLWYEADDSKIKQIPISSALRRSMTRRITQVCYLGTTTIDNLFIQAFYETPESIIGQFCICDKCVNAHGVLGKQFSHRSTLERHRRTLQTEDWQPNQQEPYSHEEELRQIETVFASEVDVDINWTDGEMELREEDDQLSKISADVHSGTLPKQL